jgi:Peptidase family C78
MALTRWILEYFEPVADGSSGINGKRSAFEALTESGGSVVRTTDKMPLYLQHQGHSRTVVGIEVARNGEMYLLVFDPARSAELHPLIHGLDLPFPPLKLGPCRQCPTKIRKAAKGGSQHALAQSIDSSDRERPKKKGPLVKKSRQLLDQLNPAAPLNYDDHARILDQFRVSLRDLSRKDQYQVRCIYVTSRRPFVT